MNRALVAIASLAFVAACADSSSLETSTSASNNDPGGSNPAGGDDNGKDGKDGPNGDGNTKPSTRGPFKSYVIFGDSISDRGGSGPYFYDLLADDLKDKFGDIKVSKHSNSGAVSSQLAAQVKSAPAELPGPVAVSVTIGGNDMQAAALNILRGTDDKARAAYATNLQKAYDELLGEGRFGAGVEVTIFHSTLYDPSDGEGNFAEAGCPGYLGMMPKQSTTTYWDNWNQTAMDALAKYGDSVVIVDTRTRFHGHGVGKLEDGTSWFDPDCIHPNTAGHEALRKLFFSSIAP